MYLGKVIGTRTWGGEVWLSQDNILVDRGVATAAQQAVYGLPERPGAKALADIAEPWRPYRSIATWYVWRRGTTSIEQARGLQSPGLVRRGRP